MDEDSSGDKRSDPPTPEDSVESDRLTGYIFAVNRTPYCCWEWDLEERNLRFLESLDTGYYGYVADLCISELESDSKLSASIVLRGAYHQAVETLVSLLGAYVQAPEAVPAWLAKASTPDLEEVAQVLLDGRELLAQGGLQSVSLDQLAHHVHQFCWTDESGPDSTAAHFGRFWGVLCRDLVDPNARAEYNAIKHGLRIAPGGFTLAVGVEGTPGVRASEMRSLGGSVFGSTFLRSERVGKSRHHFRVRRSSLNWSATSMARRLLLISMSINNVVGSLRCELGVDPETVRFLRPDPIQAFDHVHESAGVLNSSLDTVVRVHRDDEWSKDRLLKELERRGQPSQGEPDA